MPRSRPISDRHTPAELRGRPGLVGLDIETAALPGAEQRPLLKLRKDGLPAKHQPKLEERRRSGPAPVADSARAALRRRRSLPGAGHRPGQLDVLRPVLQRRTMVIHNAGFELRYLAAAGLPVPHFEDTMQAAGLLLGVNQRSLDDAAFAYLGIELPKELQISDWSAPQLSEGQLAYAALDAIIAFRLWLRLRAELVSKERGGAYLLQRDVTPAVTRMTSRGILLDRAAHHALGAVVGAARRCPRGLPRRDRAASCRARRTRSALSRAGAARTAACAVAAHGEERAS